MPSYLITGSSRGLGLAFAKELLKDPNNYVIATARNTEGSQGLKDLAAQYPRNRLSVVQLDVSDEKSIASAVTEVEKLLPNGLDNFVSNAGRATEKSDDFLDLEADDFLDELNFGLVSTVLVIRAFLPLIRKGGEKKIVVLSSILGSVEQGFHMPGLANTYSVVKAGLNMLIRKWSALLKGEGIVAFMIHPGWVGETSLGSTIDWYMAKYAPHVPNVPEVESAEGVIKVLKNAKIEDAGAFYNYDGTTLPW